MTGRITHMPNPIHPCELPTPVGLPPMTTWQCDDCGDEWLLIPPADLAHHPNPSRTWWSRDPGMPESGYRPFRWPWKRRNRR